MAAADEQEILDNLLLADGKRRCMWGDGWEFCVRRYATGDDVYDTETGQFRGTIWALD